MQFADLDVQRLRLKLRHKVAYHLGYYCPDIDDVVQETLARLLVALRDDRIRNLESLGAFASATCNNVIHEYRRGRRREVGYDVDPPVDRTTPSGARLLEVQNLVATTLSELPERDRNLLSDFYLEEKSPEQICRETGLTENYLRVALFRARERFRKISDPGVKYHSAERH